MHSEFGCEFKVLSNHDQSTLEITFCSAYNLSFLHHRIKNCLTLEIGVQCIQNLHVNSQYSQIMTTLPQKFLFAVHRNIIRYFQFGPMEKTMKQITAIFVDHDVLYKISILHPALYTVCLYSPSLFFTIRIIGNGNNQLFKISMSPYTRSDTMKRNKGKNGFFHYNFNSFKDSVDRLMRLSLLCNGDFSGGFSCHFSGHFSSPFYAAVTSAVTSVPRA